MKEQLRMVNTIDKGMLSDEVCVEVHFFVSREGIEKLQKILNIPLDKWAYEAKPKDYARQTYERRMFSEWSDDL